MWWSTCGELVGNHMIAGVESAWHTAAPHSLPDGTAAAASCLPELLLMLPTRPDQLVVVETSDGEASRRWHHLRLPGHPAKLPHLSSHQHSPALTIIISQTVNWALLAREA